MAKLILLMVKKLSSYHAWATSVSQVSSGVGVASGSGVSSTAAATAVGSGSASSSWAATQPVLPLASWTLYQEPSSLSPRMTISVPGTSAATALLAVLGSLRTLIFWVEVTTPVRRSGVGVAVAASATTVAWASSTAWMRAAPRDDAVDDYQPSQCANGQHSADDDNQDIAQYPADGPTRAAFSFWVEPVNTLQPVTGTWVVHTLENGTCFVILFCRQSVGELAAFWAGT